MLLISTYVAKSQIHGFGLFAGEDVAEGHVIWEYDGDVDKEFEQAEFEAFPADLREWLRPYLYVSHSARLVLCGDNAKYMNHSYKPNCTETPHCTIAGRKIRAGEELTCDYRELGLERESFDFSTLV